MVDMVVDISESVPLMPSQRLRLMLSMVLMDLVDMVVLDTVLTPMDWVLLAIVVLDILATPPMAIAVDMVDMVVDILESVPLMPSQRLRLMLSMVLMDMVDLDTVHTLMLAILDMLVLDTTLTQDMVVLATPTLVMAVDTDMAVDSDIMVKYFQSIEDKYVNGLPNPNTLQQCTFSLKYILSAK